jgi:hypothetical protein
MADSFSGMIAVGVISLIFSLILFYYAWIVPKTVTGEDSSSQPSAANNFGGLNPLRQKHAGESSV